jgi:hypothetical protein
MYTNRWFFIVGWLLLAGMLAARSLCAGIARGEQRAGQSASPLGASQPSGGPVAPQGDALGNPALPPGAQPGQFPSGNLPLPGTPSQPAGQAAPGGPSQPANQPPPLPAGLPPRPPDLIGRIQSITAELLTLDTPDGAHPVMLAADTRFLTENGTALFWQDLRPGDVVGVFWSDTSGNVAVPATSSSACQRRHSNFPGTFSSTQSSSVKCPHPGAARSPGEAASTPPDAPATVIMPPMRTRFSPLYLLAIPLLCLVAFGVYNLPFVHERLAWRVDNFIGQVKYAINPPEEVIFVPQEQAQVQVEQIVQATLAVALPSATSSPTATFLPTVTRPGPTTTPAPTDTAIPSPTPIPASVRLTGFVHEYQKWNNCGPATLHGAFWGWQGSQPDAAAAQTQRAR